MTPDHFRRSYRAYLLVPVWQAFAACMVGWTLFWLAALCQWSSLAQDAAGFLFFAGLVWPAIDRPARHPLREKP